MKVAITSTDGVSVNEHFGKASDFLIYTIDKGSITLVEKRKVTPYCKSSQGTEETPHSFNADAFLEIYNQISDCQVLYTKQIGEVPLAKFTKIGLKVQTCACEIESIVGCGGNCCH